ncbi:MAG: cupin domain-containing protein [Tannerella sp.]|jgi:glucose-6-phosphate isomerase|nr:cupin domain-containing protein [Tannerella sp.]
MNTQKITMPSLFFSGNSLAGEEVVKSARKLGDLAGIFGDEVSFAALPAETPVYEVYSHLPVREGTPGGLYFGLTKLYPGKVEREYFMTKGHFHQQTGRTEYYWCLEGEGVLILMDGERNGWAEKMFPGSLHHIAGGVAHRVANTGSGMLSFAAAWPSDAGHDYATIASDGFSARLLEVNGVPQLEITNH